MCFLFAHCRLPNAWVCEADALVVLNYGRILEGRPREHRLWSWWELSSSRMEQKCDEQGGCHQPLFRDFLGTHLPRAVTRAGQRISQSKWHLQAREEAGDSKKVHFLSVIVPSKAVTANRPCSSFPSLGGTQSRSGRWVVCLYCVSRLMACFPCCPILHGSSMEGEVLHGIA